MSKKQNLEMSFPVTNDLVKMFNKKCCDWGQRKSPYDVEGQIRGNLFFK